MIFYCPVCKKLDTDFRPTHGLPRVGNMRDGYGRPLYHIKCDCGNYLAAYMTFTEEVLSTDDGDLSYIKDVIKGYNKGGCYYTDGFYEYVEDRINKIEERKRELLEERDRVAAMSDEEKKKYFDNKYIKAKK